VLNSPFQQMNHIAQYIRACEEYIGLKPSQIFETTDLYEKKNINAVSTNTCSFHSFICNSAYVLCTGHHAYPRSSCTSLSE
jgi:hypothetical protein